MRKLATIMLLLAFAGDVFQLIVATLVIEIMSALFIPAKDATLPNLVPRERLVEANRAIPGVRLSGIVFGLPMSGFGFVITLMDLVLQTVLVRWLPRLFSSACSARPPRGRGAARPARGGDGRGGVGGGGNLGLFVVWLAEPFQTAHETPSGPF